MPNGRPGGIRRGARLLLVVLATAVGASLARGQAPLGGNSYDGWHFGGGGGLHLFGPVRASLALGVGWQREERALQDRSRFLFAFLEPGLSGSRVSVGYAESVGSIGGGWSARASLLKLTREPSRRLMTGLELQVIAFACLGTRVGAFRPLDRDRHGQRTLWLADLSVCL